MIIIEKFFYWFNHSVFKIIRVVGVVIVMQSTAGVEAFTVVSVFVVDKWVGLVSW